MNGGAADQTIGSSVNISGSRTATLNATGTTAGNLTFTGSLLGSGTLTQAAGNGSARTLNLNGDNSGFTGSFVQNNDGNNRTAFGTAASGSANAAWTFNRNVSGGVALNFTGATIQFGSLSGGGYIRANNAGTATVEVGGLNTNSTFSGIFQQSSGTTLLKLRKVGTGTLTLSGSSSYTAGTDINGGAISVNNASGIGTAGTISFGGGKLIYGSGITTDFSSRFTNGAGQLVSIDTGGNNVTFGSALTSSGGTLTKSGAGTLTLGGANSYTGKTTIAGGALSVAAANGLGGNPGSATADQVTISNGGKLLVTTGFTANANAGMTIGSGGGTVEVNGAQSLVQGGGLSGSGALSKSGSGTLSLTNTSGDYSGTITVTNGTLQVNTALASAAVIVGNTVSKGSTLSGAGTLGAVTINSGGIIAPGNSPGTLSVSSLTLNGGGGYNWEMTDAAGVAGTGWDLINVGSGSGTLSIGATSGNQFSVYVIGNNPSNFNAANPYSWTIIDAGTITGFDANAFAIDTSGFVGFSGNLGNFAVSTNSGNLLLDYTPVSSSYDVTVASGSQTQSEATGGAAQFTGASALNKLGAGTLVMTNSANDYTGLTSVKEGTMQINVNAPNNAPGALGSAATAVVIGSTTNAAAAGFNIGVAGVTNGRALSTVAGTGAADRVIGTTITSGIAEQAGNVSANTNTSFSAAGGGTLLVSGGVGGSGALTVTNTGTTIFSGANNYTGTTTVASNATLRLGSSTALGTADGATTVNDGGVLAYSNNISVGEAVTINGTGISSGGAIRNISGANTNSGVVTLGSSSLITADSGTSLNLSGGVAGGANALTKAGNGTLTISGVSTFTGGTTVNAGTLNLGVGGSTGTLRGTLTINSGATVKATAVDALGYTAGVSLTNVTINGGTFDNAATNNNGYITTFFMNGGTISSSGGGAINFNGTGYGITTSSNAETATVSAPITLRANGATFNVAAGSTSSGVDLLSTGVINGGYGWVKTGAGTMKITTGTDFGSSWFTNNGGTIILGQTNQAAFTTAVINSGATLKMDPTGQVASAQAWSGQFANDVTINAGGVWDLNDTGTNGVNNRVKFVYGAGTISNSGTGESLVVIAVRDYNTGKTNTLSIVDGSNGGTVALSVVSSGGSFNGLAAALAGSNSYSGATTLSDAHLTAGSTTAFSPNSAVYFNWGGRLNLGGYDNTVGGLANGLSANPTGTTNVDLGANILTLTNKAATSLSFAGVIAGTGGLIKNGTGTQILTGANTYSGGTLVSAGVLQGNATGLQGSITNNASVVFDQTGAGTYAGDMSGSGTLSAIGAGTLTLSGNNSYSGKTTISTGTVKLGSATALGSTNGLTELAGGRLDLNGQTTAEYLTNSSSSSVLANSSASTGTLSSDATLVGDLAVTNTGNIDAQRLIGLYSPRTITKSGTGTLTTAGAGHNNLAAWVINGGTVNLANTSGYGADRGVTINTNGTLKLSGSNYDLINDGQAFTVNGGTFDLNGKAEAVAAIGGTNGTIRNSAAGAATLYVGGGVSGTSSASWSGTIQNGTGTLAVVKEGTGTQTLSGNNTYTGGTTVSGGTLRLASATAAGTGTITQSSGSSTLEIDTTGTVTNAMSIYNISTLQSVTLSGNKTLNNATYTVADTTTTTDSGNLSGAGGVTKEGLGTLILTGDNSYTGAVNVNAGLLNLDSSTGGAAASTTSVSVASGATLLVSQSNQVNNSAAVTLSGGTIQRASGVSEVFGALNLTDASFLNFGSGTAGNMTFGTYQNDTPSALLTVNNFFGGNTLKFGSDLSGYLPSLYNGTSFTSDYFNINSTSGGFTSSWNGSSFTITAIPEPSTYLAATGLLGLMLWPTRRRLMRDVKTMLGLRRPARERLESYRHV